MDKNGRQLKSPHRETIDITRNLNIPYDQIPVAKITFQDISQPTVPHETIDIASHSNILSDLFKRVQSIWLHPPNHIRPEEEGDRRTKLRSIHFGSEPKTDIVGDTLGVESSSQEHDGQVTIRLPICGENSRIATLAIIMEAGDSSKEKDNWPRDLRALGYKHIEATTLEADCPNKEPIILLPKDLGTSRESFEKGLLHEIEDFVGRYLCQDERAKHSIKFNTGTSNSDHTALKSTFYIVKKVTFSEDTISCKEGSGQTVSCGGTTGVAKSKELVIGAAPTPGDRSTNSLSVEIQASFDRATPPPMSNLKQTAQAGGVGSGGTSSTILPFDDDSDSESDEDGDDEMETSSDDDSGCCDSWIPSSGVEIQEWEDREINTRKRSARGGFAGHSSSCHYEPPTKRLKIYKGQSKPMRLFACPYFKRNPLKYSVCSGWRSRKVSQVRQHCKTDHLKPFWCGRCKKFRASSHDQVMQHLMNENCEKSVAFYPAEKDEVKKKSYDLDKARTWQGIYEILFPLHIPNQFWQDSTEVLMSSLKENELLFALRAREAINSSKKDYQLGLAKFFKDRLAIGEVRRRCWMLRGIMGTV